MLNRTQKQKNLYILEVIFYVMESITKLRKVGGSIVATVPKKIIELEGLVPGQTVKITVEKLKKSFFGAAKGVGSFSKEDEKWMEGRSHD